MKAHSLQAAERIIEKINNTTKIGSLFDTALSMLPNAPYRLPEAGYVEAINAVNSQIGS